MTSVDPDVVHAVWAGRFQPFHRGHMSSLKRICGVFDGPVVLAIIASSPRVPIDSYSAEASAQHRAEKNPLTVWERLMMIRMSLEAESLSDRVIPIGIPRPDAHWDTVQSFYPPQRVLFFTNRNSFEAMKVAHWRSLGEAVQIIDAEGDLSGTLFKETVRSGGNWRSFLLAATIEYFIAIDGPSRFVAAD